jgi:ribonuclease Z
VQSLTGPTARLVRKEVSGIRLVGYSHAGEESFVAVPEYNVSFDVGRAPREVIPIDNVCISHGHMDHAAGAAYYLSQRGFLGIAPGRIIVHKSLAPAFERLMAVWAEIEGHPSPGVIVGVEPMQDVPLRRGLLVRPFAVNHCDGALGFSLIEARHKLKPEFHGKTGPELVALKKRGVQIEENVEISLVTYTGDTALGRFLDYSFVRKTKLLILECTFFERDHRTRAAAGRHIHVSDLPKVLAAAPEAQLLLIHVSLRTDLRQAKRMLQRVVPSHDTHRVQLFMETPPRGSPPPRGVPE